LKLFIISGTKGVARGGPGSQASPVECSLALLRINNEQVLKV